MNATKQHFYEYESINVMQYKITKLNSINEKIKFWTFALLCSKPRPKVLVSGAARSCIELFDSGVMQGFYVSDDVTVVLLLDMATLILLILSKMFNQNSQTDSTIVSQQQYTKKRTECSSPLISCHLIIDWLGLYMGTAVISDWLCCFFTSYPVFIFAHF
jgi:hypothetical protein